MPGAESAFAGVASVGDATVDLHCLLVEVAGDLHFQSIVDDDVAAMEYGALCAYETGTVVIILYIGPYLEAFLGWRV